MEKTKKIEIFEGKTFEDLVKDIYERSTEERDKALKIFTNISDRVQDNEDVFMIGDKSHPYLAIAHQSTDNLIKLMGTIHKVIETESAGVEEDVFDKNSLFDLMDKQNLIPDELAARDEEPTVEEEEMKDAFKGFEKEGNAFMGEEAPKTKKETKKKKSNFKIELELNDDHKERYNTE
jgi:hypothetical protein